MRRSITGGADETTPLVHGNKTTALRGSVLQRYWRALSVASWIFYAVFVIALWNGNTNDPLCSDTAKDYPPWYWNACSAVLASFITIILVVLNKIFGVKVEHEKVPLYFGLNIVFRGSLSTALILFFQWGGICVDALGVATPAPLWPEWCANGPLIIFITLTIVDKPTLSKMDIFFMVTFFLSLISGFMIIGQSKGVGEVWLFVSCAAYAPLLCIPWYTRRQTTFKKDLENGAAGLFDDAAEEMLAARHKQQQCLVYWVSIIFPFFTINYIAAYLNFIDQPTTISIFLVLSLMIKGLIAMATMTAHLDLNREAEKRVLKQESKVKSARRSFMRFGSSCLSANGVFSLIPYQNLGTSFTKSGRR